jgi:uncharacterized protein YdeI (YjbR/CyaY-like superfamily)
MAVRAISVFAKTCSGSSKWKRVVVEPPELTQALADDPAAQAAYQKLPLTHRNEYARWIDEGKKPETRADRVAKTIKRLTEPR